MQIRSQSTLRPLLALVLLLMGAVTASAQERKSAAERKTAEEFSLIVAHTVEEGAVGAAR